nr:MAG: sugar ABC transporter permease [Caldicoprobacter oshimai]
MQTRGEKVFSYINHVLLFVICIITLYPLWHVAIASISDPILVFAKRGFYLWPLGKATLKGYSLVFDNPNIVSGYLNTLFYVVVGTSLSMVVTILGAYVLSRKGPYWNKVVMGLIIFYMYFQGGLIPFFIMVKNMGLMDSRWAVILPTVVNTWNLIVMRTSFTSVPDSLIESAKLDGASEWRIVWVIAVPVLQATVAVIALFYAVGRWNEWFNPSLFLTSRDKFPLQVILREILLKNSTQSMTQIGVVGQSEQESYRLLVKYCTIMVATVPILLIYPFLQRYFIHGIMIGSLKG